MKTARRLLIYVIVTALISLPIVNTHSQDVAPENKWSELTKNAIDAVVIVMADLPSSDANPTTAAQSKLPPKLFFKTKPERIKTKEKTQLIKPILLAEEEIEGLLEGWPITRRRNINLGTGTIIHPKGFVLTNSHVVEKATNVKVILRDGRSFDTEIVAQEPRYDAALLKIKTPKLLNLSYLKAAPLNTIEAGQMFIATGHPLGLFFNTQLGIVAHAPPENSLEAENMENSIIMRGAGIFPPGSSGTPLINSDKRVVGMLFAAVEKIYSPGFAVAVEPIIKHFLKEKRLPPIPE